MILIVEVVECYEAEHFCSDELSLNETNGSVERPYSIRMRHLCQLDAEVHAGHQDRNNTQPHD